MTHVLPTPAPLAETAPVANASATHGTEAASVPPAAPPSAHLRPFAPAWSTPKGASVIELNPKAALLELTLEDDPQVRDLAVIAMKRIDALEGIDILVAEDLPCLADEGLVVLAALLQARFISAWFFRHERDRTLLTRVEASRVTELGRLWLARAGSRTERTSLAA